MRFSSLLLIAAALGASSPAVVDAGELSAPGQHSSSHSHPHPKPSHSHPHPKPHFASVAGQEAEGLCKSLVNIKPSHGLNINNTFAEYYPEGSMPSLELLSETYPAGTIPPGTDVPGILDSVGPDVDIKSNAGYAKANTRAARHGPVGSMPAFCRFGAFVITSDVTNVLSEVWLPLKSDPNIPLAPVNSSDTITNSTAFLMGQDGRLERQPLYAQKGEVTRVKAMPGSSGAPNDEAEPVANEDSMSDPSDSPAKKRMVRTAAEKRAKRETVLSGDEILKKGDGWNGRLAVIGNGAQRGFVPLADLKQMVSRYNFVMAGSNAGHFSTGSSTTWVNGSVFDDTLLDFGSRANHVTMQLAEDVINTFYGPKAGKRKADDDDRVLRYYMGSSVGAARGLSAVQEHPHDFHGVILGPPANQFMDLNAGQIHITSVHNRRIAKNGRFTQNELYGPMKDVITRQCDKLDGVEDKIISNPFDCKPNYQEMLCGTNTKYGSSSGTCLTQVQIDNAYNLYKDTIIDGHKIYPAYLPGLEDSATSMGTFNAKASGWYQLVVQHLPMFNPDFDAYTDMTYAELQRGNAEDPGGVNAAKTDLSAFFNKKRKGGAGKIVMYHGSYDLVVSPQATIEYYENVLRDTPGAEKLFKFFFVPGMRHSRGGPGAWNFGGPTQNDPGNRPLSYDTKHDVILATMAWVEKDLEPKTIVAARYTQREAMLPARDTSGDAPDDDLPIPDTQQNYNWGLTYTRLLCPWPKQAKYNGGPTTGAKAYKSFSCA